MITKFVSRIDLSESRVDRKNNVIRAVSLVSLGEAKGHNKWADQKTLEQVRDCARQYPTGLRVRFNANTFTHGDAALAGFIAKDSIKIEGNKVVGDLHVFSSYPHKDYLYEMAERAPDTFGLSIEFNGVAESIDGSDYARCDEIFAATVVDLPAANPTGLFAVGEGKISKEPNDMSMTDEQVTKLGTQIVEGLSKSLTPVFQNAFRMQQGNQDDSAPTEEELAAAGCTDEMTDDEKKSKVMEWRKKDANQPVTKKDLLQLFRFTGGNAARSSGEVTVDDKNKAQGNGAFESLVIKYRAAGMKDAKAILRAREDDKPGYNAWCKKGRPEISDKVEAK